MIITHCQSTGVRH